MSLYLLLAAMAIVVIVLADFFVPMVPSATMIATAAGFIVGQPALIAGLVLFAAAASWLGDVLGLRVLRGSRVKLGRLMGRSAKIARIEARLRDTLTRHPHRTTLIARFAPAGRTALAWAAVDAPGYRHGRMAALAGAAWASYIVGLGLLIGWIFGPGIFSLAMTATSVTALGLVLAWYFRAPVKTAPAQINLE